MWNFTKIFICEKSINCYITGSLLNFLGIYKIPNSFAVSHVGKYRRLCANISSQSNDEIPPQLSHTEKSTRKKRSSKAQRQSNIIVSTILCSNDELDVKCIPAKFISKIYTRTEGLYVVGKKTANTIAESMVEDGVNIPVFEVNPGLGVVTKALFEKNIREIHAFQLSFWMGTSELLSKHSGKLYAHRYDFFALWKRLLVDHYEDEAVQDLMSLVKQKKWNDGPPVKIFAAVPNRLFINHMIASLVFEKGFYQLGHLDFYLAMKPKDYYIVTSDGAAGYAVYRATPVLFQILFEIKLLCKLPSKDFIPWLKEPSKKKIVHQFAELDAEYMYLVKVTPRKELNDLVQGAENLMALWHFVRQCFTVRSNRVIPTLEKWIPGCGPRLIFNNMTIFTEFGELSPLEMVKLYQMFSKWPEYQDCSFLDSMESYLLKAYIENNPDESGVEFESVDDTMEGDSFFY